MRKFKGRWHEQVPTEQVQPGDYIEFTRQGYRVRKVRSVNLGRKHRYVRFEPMKHEPFKSYVVNLEDIQSVWRRCDGHRRATNEDGGGDPLREDLPARLAGLTRRARKAASAGRGATTSAQ